MALGHGADRLSAAVKALILDRELEELTGRRHATRQPVKAVVPKASTGRRGRVSADRWRMPIDLRWPAPIATARPRSSDGATSFHMRVTTHSRPHEDAGGQSVATPGGGHGAAGFDVYVTDGLAVSQIGSAGFDRYATDASSPHDPHVEPGSRVAFLITNIDHDPDQRAAFWEARHRAARRRGNHVIEFAPKRGSLDQWLDLESDADLPNSVRGMVVDIIGKLEADVATDGRGTRIGKRRVRLESPSEIAWAERIGKRFGAAKAGRMVHYIRPRGGQIQRRFDAEIPAALDFASTLQIARELAVLIARLKLPFVLAIHRPDDDNDSRNWHLHLIYFPQPGERQNGSWSFGKAGGGPGMLRPGDIARGLNGHDAIAEGAWYKLGAAADLRALREGYAAICNATLESVGDARRLDPRSFTAMGIAKRPERHLGSAETRLVFAGIDTLTSRTNATRNWEWVITQRLAEVDQTHGHMIARLDAIGDAGSGIDRQRERLVADWDALRLDQRELVLVDARLEIARSGATRVKENCERTLDRIASGDASSSDRRSEGAIRARLRLAEHHLVEIADAVEPWHADLEACRRDLGRRKADLVRDIDALAEQACQVEHSWQDVVARVRQMKHHVWVDQMGPRPYARVVGLEASDQAILDDQRVRASAQAALMTTADHQRRAMERVLASVRQKGLDATSGALAGKTNAPRAEAKLLLRYKDHPYLVRHLKQADEEWHSNALRDADEISRRIAALRPSPRPVAVPAPIAQKDSERTSIGVTVPPVAASMPSRETPSRPTAAKEVASTAISQAPSVQAPAAIEVVIDEPRENRIVPPAPPQADAQVFASTETAPSIIQLEPSAIIPAELGLGEAATRKDRTVKPEIGQPDRPVDPFAVDEPVPEPVEVAAPSRPSAHTPDREPQIEPQTTVAKDAAETEIEATTAVQATADVGDRTIASTLEEENAVPPKMSVQQQLREAAARRSPRTARPAKTAPKPSPSSPSNVAPNRTLQGIGGPTPEGEKPSKAASRAAAVDAALAKAHATVGVSEAANGALRTKVGLVADYVRANLLSFQLEGETILAFAAEPSVFAHVRALVDLPDGRTALRIIADATVHLGPASSHKQRYEVWIEAGDAPGLSIFKGRLDPGRG